MEKEKIIKMIFFFILILFLSGWMLQAQDLAVGKILSISGDIELDPFGNDSFIKVRESGVSLYKNSIIKSGPDSSFIILIMDTQYEYQQHSHISINKIVELETRKNRNRWFSPLLDVIHKVTGFLFPVEESVDLISRGDGMPGITDTLFSFEEEDDDKADFQLELDVLFQNPDLEETGYSASEYDYRLGFCYFQLGNYEDAAKLFDSCYELISDENRTADTAPHFLDSLYLMEGIAKYMLADYEAAVFFFENFLSQNVDNEYVPYASWLMSDALVSLGKKDLAQGYVDKAKQYFSGHDLKNEFVMFMNSIQ